MRLRLYMLIFFGILLAAICTPFVVWQAKPAATLHVAILDKTVPDASYREHKGLVWLLNHLKYTKKDQTAYSVQHDYFGYVPAADSAPSSYALRELNIAEAYDLLYIADTYGVYEDDLQVQEDRIRGNRSTKIVGGLTLADIDQIKKAVYEGSTLIAEFNTIASPTESEAREELYHLLGIHWSGWIGRYFDDLSPGVEVPDWAIRNYEQQTGAEWTFTGSGFLFVNEQDHVVILEEGTDTGKRGSEFVLTPEGEQFIGKPIRVKYNYWFDIIEARNDTEVLAYYELDMTEAGREKLADAAIPPSFPAVIKNVSSLYTSYYFAGDYADNGEVSGFYQAAWLDRLFQLVASDASGSQQRFYWKAYRPLMERIFSEIVHNKQAKLDAEQPDIAMTEDGLFLQARVGGEDYIQIYRDGKWEDLFIKGVNIGMGKPGAFPGDAAITKGEYLRWFRQIGEMNANVIRNYTIHPPGFYEALLEYNSKAAEPLYLLHGVWINEETLIASQDAFAAENQEEFIAEMKRAADIIHGRADIPHRPGHASGSYRADISNYVLGWVLGIEWDPVMVTETNDKHKGMPDYNGAYFETSGASPFEIWLARMMDTIAVYEAEQYAWQRPISFTNWITTDLLEHPSEPLDNEDLVEVNPNHLFAKAGHRAGLFATYHVYPYYPDFLNYQPNYTEYIDHRGEKNSYAGYLNDLRQSHRMPVLIAEFGVPTSRGMTHRNIRNWNQGFNSERQQGEYSAYMFDNIYEEQLAGGIVFTWQDEWFKRAWNTMDLDNPDRRPFWSNVQVSEQQFGLLTFVPGTPERAMYVDGDTEDWERRGLSSISLSGGSAPSPLESAAAQAPDSATAELEIRQMWITSDESAVYIRLDVNAAEQPLDWSTAGIMLLLDTIPDQGQHTVPGGSGLATDAGIDFAVDLRGPEQSRIWVDSYYDSTYYMYGERLNMIPSLDYANQKNNGTFHKMELVLNQPMAVPNVHGETLHLPFESYETGLLRFGNGHPHSPEFDSLTDVSYNETTGVLELRIPWQLLNVKDPSLWEIMSDLWTDGLEGSQETAGFRIAALIYQRDERDRAEQPGGRRMTYAMPAITNNMLRSEDMYVYQWERWEQPSYHERLKQSYDIMREAYGRY